MAEAPVNVVDRAAQAVGVGTLLKEWRIRRHLSQLDLACEAEVSTRHLSFLETGRSQPSREMILHLAERLNIPLRDRNILLVRAGFAAIYSERSLSAPELDAARKAVDMVLTGHEPYPAIAVDRHWNLIQSNKSIGPLIQVADPELLSPPVNVLRLTLHPSGMAPYIANLSGWRAHLLTRLHRQIDTTADPILTQLYDELKSYPGANGTESGPLPNEYNCEGVVVPFKLMTEHGLLSLFGTTTIFGTPLDITLSELALETFFPADEATRGILMKISTI